MFSIKINNIDHKFNMYNYSDWKTIKELSYVHNYDYLDKKKIQCNNNDDNDNISSLDQCKKDKLKNSMKTYIYFYLDDNIDIKNNIDFYIDKIINDTDLKQFNIHYMISYVITQVEKDITNTKLNTIHINTMNIYTGRTR